MIEMVIGIIGENCSGKSTLAEELGKVIGAEIVTGKDYLRMARNEQDAAAAFRSKLSRALTDGNIIYVISEKEHVALLPPGAVKVLVRADLETIKERFRARMHGHLPVSVEQMLEKKHGMFDGDTYDYRFHSGTDDAADLYEELKKRSE